MTVWLVVAVVGAGTIALKSVGPALLGQRPLPDRVAALVALLAPTLLAALVATATFQGGEGLAADARLVGMGTASVAIALRAPLLLVVVAAAGATALTRLLA